jgi:2-phospho-L-lactate guanylyltransferase
MKTVGIIPVKSFERGKSRLAEVLPDAERMELARALFLHVLAVARGSGALDEILVATDGDDVAALAGVHGARVLRDPPLGARLGDVVDAAIADVAGSTDAVLVLMGDLPRLVAIDVSTTIGLLADADLVLAPDLRDEGTNALAMRTPRTHRPVRTAFGHAASFARHRLLCAKDRVAVHRSEGLGFDVDTARDWRLFRGGDEELERSRRA